MTSEPVPDPATLSTGNHRFLDQLKRFGRRLVDDGRADLAALGRAIARLGRMLVRRHERDSHRKELRDARRELGRRACDLPGVEEFSGHAAVAAAQQDFERAQNALHEISEHRDETAGLLRRQREDAERVIGFLRDEESSKYEALKRAEKEGATAEIEALRRGLGEVERVLAERRAELRAEEGRLESELELKQDAREAALSRRHECEERLVETQRLLGRELQRAGFDHPLVSAAAERVKTLAVDVTTDETELIDLEQGLRRDRHRAVRAVAVLLGAIVLLLLVIPSGADAPPPERGEPDTVTRRDQPSTPTKAPGNEPARKASPTAKPAPELARALRAHPLIAALDLEGELIIEASRPVAGGSRRHEVRVRMTSGEEARFVALTDGRGQLIDLRREAAPGPEDDELFRLLEQR